jgi:hypothetical protein
VSKWVSEDEWMFAGVRAFEEVSVVECARGPACLRVSSRSTIRGCSSDDRVSAYLCVDKPRQYLSIRR